MSDLIRLGDATDHGGKVVSASPPMRYDGRARGAHGRQRVVPRHPEVRPNLIIEGDASMQDHGVPIARHGHRATCGCKLISSLL